MRGRAKRAICTGLLLFVSISASALPVRVTWQGAPVEGLLVKALAEADPTLRIQSRSGHDGRTTLRLPAGGVWLVNVVRIEAAPAGSGFDWQSTWSSLTWVAQPAGKPRTFGRQLR